jgi:hypothetical protein
MGLLVSKTSQWGGLAEYLKRTGIRCTVKRDRIIVKEGGSRIIVSQGLDVLRVYSTRYKTLYIDYNRGPYYLRGHLIDIPETMRLFRLAYIIKNYFIREFPYRLFRIWVYREDRDGDIDIIIRH